MGSIRWSDSEKDIIKKHFDPKKSSESAQIIIDKFLPHRTIPGIQYCASRMGLVRNIRRPQWNDVEIARLIQLAEKKPFPEIYTQMKYFWASKGLRARTEMAVRHELARLGLNTKEHSYLTVKDLCDGLRCNDSVVYRWFTIRGFCDILAPIHNGYKSPYYVRASNFRKFASRYPSEIARCSPDILWLVSILTSDYE